MKFFKRLFCNHDFRFVRKTSGDENNYARDKRNVYKCRHCGKYEFREL